MTTEQEEEFLAERNKNTKKLILIENLENINLTTKKKKDFIKFYYDNIDMNLEEALALFKKK